MKLKIIIIFLFQICILRAQTSDKLKKLVIPLNTFSYAESSHIGVAGERSKIYNYFRELSKVAKNDELYYFAKYGSNALKLYSSQELFKRNDKRFLEIYHYYLDNPLIMKYQNGCTIEKDNIATYLKKEVLSAKYIISVRDSLLKAERNNLVKSQLKSIYEEGYKHLSQKDLEFYLREIEKIDSEK